MCVLYEPIVPRGKRQPRTFSSPVSSEPFDRVTQMLRVEVAIRRAEHSYAVEAAIPLKVIGCSPKPGTITKGDLGVIFSDPGGSRNVLRAYYANKDTAIVNDIPSEARLEPRKWGVVRVE